jgi:hypothetical protein
MAGRGHHRRKGGEVDMPEEHGGKPMSYTADNNVEKEAEGEERSKGGRAKRARGGAAKHHVEHHQAEHVEHHHYKRGGAMKEAEMEGDKTKHRRMDRPGRKRGGGIGADATPLSTAARTKQEGHMADNDELAS